MVEQRMVVSPCTTTTLPWNTARCSLSKTSRRSASILIGSLLLPPRLPSGPGALRSFLPSFAAGAPAAAAAVGFAGGGPAAGGVSARAPGGGAGAPRGPRGPPGGAAGGQAPRGGGGGGVLLAQ